jgi:hypothetical protein
MLLQRWRGYIENGHGDNKELRDIVNNRGFDYVRKHFQYAILENSDKDFILYFNAKPGGKKH